MVRRFGVKRVTLMKRTYLEIEARLFRNKQSNFKGSHVMIQGAP